MSNPTDSVDTACGDPECEDCGRWYNWPDVIVSDEVWNQIALAEGCLLCPSCMVERLVRKFAGRDVIMVLRGGGGTVV